MVVSKKENNEYFYRLASRIRNAKGCSDYWFGLVSLFNGISIFVGYSMSNLSLKKNSNTIQPNVREEDKGFHAFRKGIGPKVCMIAQLGFELTYNVVTVQHVNNFATETPWKHYWIHSS